MYTIRVYNGEHGMDLYIEVGGKENYIATRRPNGLLYSRLKDGITIGELRRYKPRQGRFDKKFYKSKSHLLKLVDDYLEYDLVS